VSSRGEAKLGEKKVDIMPPDPFGELGSGWEKMAAEKIKGATSLTIGRT
jgi:(E)-4-hydroxy-3-methylbut-2-enyl-diphosphate synthase